MAVGRAHAWSSGFLHARNLRCSGCSPQRMDRMNALSAVHSVWTEDILWHVAKLHGMAWHGMALYGMACVGWHAMVWNVVGKGMRYMVGMDGGIVLVVAVEAVVVVGMLKLKVTIVVAAVAVAGD